MSRIIWLARHGLRLDFIDWSWFESASRRYDPPLAASGITQGQILATRLQKEGIRHIFASPFLRTVQTGHIVAQTLTLPLKLEWGLGEWLNREWMEEMPSTTPLKFLAQDYPCLDLSYVSAVVPQYPENKLQLQQRVKTTVTHLLQKFQGDILIIGHGPSIVASIRALIPDLGDYQTDLASLTKLVQTAQGWEIKLAADTSYLGAAATDLQKLYANRE